MKTLGDYEIMLCVIIIRVLFGLGEDGWGVWFLCVSCYLLHLLLIIHLAIISSDRRVRLRTTELRCSSWAGLLAFQQYAGGNVGVVKEDVVGR